MTITIAITMIVLLDVALLAGLAAAMRSAYVRLAPPPNAEEGTSGETAYRAHRPVRPRSDSRRAVTRVRV
jgi:hypothetical protein